MKCFVGIDLGSTTTKAIVMDGSGAVLGRGITNSRSNYDTASRVSKLDAFLGTRLTLFRRGLENMPSLQGKVEGLLAAMERNFRLELFLEQLEDLHATCVENGREVRDTGKRALIEAALEEIFVRMQDQLVGLETIWLQRF